MIRARNVIPSIKDKKVRFSVPLNSPPTGSAAILFLDPWYDYQLVGMAAVVNTVTQAAACVFTLGQGAYTDSNGVIQAAVPDKFLAAAACLDKNGEPFSTHILPVGSFNFFLIQQDPNGLGLNILPAGAPMTITVPSASNTGTVTLSVALRPKDKDRNDVSKRPSGASDEAYATYFR